MSDDFSDVFKEDSSFIKDTAYMIEEMIQDAGREICKLIDTFRDDFSRPWYQIEREIILLLLTKFTRLKISRDQLVMDNFTWSVRSALRPSI